MAEILEDLGRVYISHSGRITIEDPYHASSWTQVNYRGDIREREQGGYTIRLEYEVGPSPLCVVLTIIGALFCLLLVLVLIIPSTAKSKVERSVNHCLDDIEDELDRR